MMGWRDYANQVQGARDNRDDRDESPPNAAIGPIVPNVPPLDAARALRLCVAGLDRLDYRTPLHGLDKQRWGQLLDDAEWLLVGFAQAAFRNGWVPGELFGLWHYDGGLIQCAGGIADRIDGARSLVMTEDRATWRTFLTGEPASFFRGTYPKLRPMWGAADDS